MVVYNPIDTERIIKLSQEFQPAKPERFTIISSGRLTPQKKPERVLRVARMFKDNGIDVLFQWIGDGELKEELLVLRKELEVEDMVEFLGFQKNPFPYVRQADMMFCCSGYEGFCLVICEAMCLGVPVVSTRTSGPIEILDNDKYGLLTGHSDNEMFMAVKRMMENVDLRSYYSKQGKIRVQEFAPCKIVKTIDNL